MLKNKWGVEKVNRDTVIVKLALASGRISADWQTALKTRESREYIDSLASEAKQLSGKERAWEKMIGSKANRWNSVRDSLDEAFVNIHLNDSIYVLLGCGGRDDGFTYESRTVCFDLTALQRNYGDAQLPENEERIDRLFAHEYTHLLHKAWAIKHNAVPVTFRDSILWECLYEGLGMYRSLSSKWLPAGGRLPTITINALDRLHPVFMRKMTAVLSNSSLTAHEKREISMNLSRGPVDQKWGALPVAIWMALEVQDDATNLAKWINKGPGGVMELASKYLTDFKPPE